MTSTTEDWAVLREQNDAAPQQAFDAKARLHPVDVEEDSRQVFAQISTDALVGSVRIGFSWDNLFRADQLTPTVMDNTSKGQLERLAETGLTAEKTALFAAIVGAAATGAITVRLTAAPVAVIGGIATALVAIAGTMVNLNSSASSAATKYTKISNAVGAFGSRHWPTATFS